MASSLTEGIPSDSHFHPAGPSEPKYFLAFRSPCPSPQQGFRAELERGRKGGKKTEKPRFLREGGEEREGQAQRPRQSRRPGGEQGKPGRPEGQRNRPRDTEMGRKISKDLAPPERSPCAAQAAPWGTSGLTPRGGRRSAPKLPGLAPNPGTTLAPQGRWVPGLANASLCAPQRRAGRADTEVLKGAQAGAPPLCAQSGPGTQGWVQDG